MGEPAPRISGTQILRPRARILRTFGDELSSSATEAVIELVKNAYDADATRVLVRFQEPLDVGRGRVEVMDNGHGMSLETITLQRHFFVLTKFAHVESRLSGRERQREVVFYAPVNLCDRRACSASVAVGLWGV